MDFVELDEAVKQLSVSITIEANGVEKDEWGVPISCVVLLDAHRVLDLMAGMGIMTSAIQDKRHQIMLSLPENSPLGESEQHISKWCDTFPAAVLAAVESDEFKAWVAAEKAREI